MKKGLTETVFILDKSGSMMGLVDDTIGGFNSMIEQQKNDSGESNITTVLFSSRCKMLHDCVNVQEINPMTREDFCCGGMTALLDAVGSTIDRVGERLADTPEEERPEKVVVVIVTDGYENSSIKYTKSKIKEMINHQEKKYSWTFMFLGANIDAVGEAEALGINPSLSKTYTANELGTRSVYSAVSNVISEAKCANFTDSTDYEKWVAKSACTLDSIY